MNWFLKTFSYSIGRKLIMAATGLFFVIFLLEHVAGNFLLFNNDGGAEYNLYSHTLTHNVIVGPIIKLVEIFLFASFLFHALDGTMLWIKNRRSRPVGYSVNRKKQNSSWNSRNMMLTGAVLFIFLVIHLGTFFYPYRVTESVTNLYMRVHDEFQNPWFTGFYVFSMVLLAMHLQHGFSSAFQTLGMRNHKYFPFIQKLGWILSIVVCAGFASQPLYFLFFDQLH